MTIKEYLATIPLLRAAGRAAVPVRFEDLEAMAGKTIGKVSKKELAKGKIKLVKKATPAVAKGRAAKKTRLAKALVAKTKARNVPQVLKAYARGPVEAPKTKRTRKAA